MKARSQRWASWDQLEKTLAGEIQETADALMMLAARKLSEAEVAMLSWIVAALDEAREKNVGAK